LVVEEGLELGRNDSLKSVMALIRSCDGDTYTTAARTEEGVSERGEMEGLTEMVVEVIK
jgi:hypothetical protein